MCALGTNPEVFSTKHGRTPAKEKHGKEGWYHGEKVIYFDKVGWVTESEQRNFRRLTFDIGTVFASQFSWVPLPMYEEVRGWKWNGSKRSRTRVECRDCTWIPFSRKETPVSPQ